MATPAPKDLLSSIADAVLQAAPHNVLALASRGGQVTIIPVMGRQPTMYEEMMRTPPRRVKQAAAPEAPAERGATVFDAGDQLLRYAPHNVLASLLTGGQLPSVPSVPGMQGIPAGVSLKQYATATGNYEWDALGSSILIKGPSSKVAITYPSNMALVVTWQKLKRATVYRRMGVVPQLAALEKSIVESDLSYTPGVEMPTPKQEVVGPSTKIPGAVGGLTVNEIRKRTTSEEKGPAGQIVLKRTETDYATRVTLVGVIPLAEVPTEGLPDIEGLRTQRLGEVDGWIGDASSKIGNMNLTDIPQAEAAMGSIQTYQATLASGNQTGQVPVLPPLMGGGALFPLFGGASMPLFPFVMFRGGQVGAAASQVSELGRTASRATSLKGTIDTDAQNANTAFENLKGFRQAVAVARTESDIKTNYSNAKAEYGKVVAYTGKVSMNVATMGGYEVDARESYDSGIASISAAVAAPPAPTMTREGIQALINAGRFDEAIAAARAAGMPDLERTAAIAQATEAQQQAAAAAQAGEAGYYDLIARAQSLEAQGRYDEAASLYSEAGRDDLARSALSTGAEEAQRRAAEEAERLAAEARRAEAEKTWESAMARSRAMAEAEEKRKLTAREQAAEAARAAREYREKAKRRS